MSRGLFVVASFSVLSSFGVQLHDTMHLRPQRCLPRWWGSAEELQRQKASTAAGYCICCRPLKLEQPNHLGKAGPQSLLVLLRRSLYKLLNVGSADLSVRRSPCGTLQDSISHELT